MRGKTICLIFVLISLICIPFQHACSACMHNMAILYAHIHACVYHIDFNHLRKHAHNTAFSRFPCLQFTAFLLELMTN